MLAEMEKEMLYTLSHKGNKKTTWAELTTRLLQLNDLKGKTHIYKYLKLYTYTQTSSFITLCSQSKCNTYRI